MKYIALLILITFTMSCTVTYNCDQLNNLKKPVIVIAKTKDRKEDDCLIVIDGDNVHHILSISQRVNKALYDTYNVRDTIK